jgi:hypothetical protein
MMVFYDNADKNIGSIIKAILKFVQLNTYQLFRENQAPWNQSLE